jgi:hypothetical protein
MSTARPSKPPISRRNGLSNAKHDRIVPETIHNGRSKLGAEAGVQACNAGTGTKGRLAVDLYPVQRGVGAAHGNARSLTARAGDLYTRDELQSLADVLVRELASIFRQDGVQYLRRLALGIERVGEALTNAGYYDIRTSVFTLPRLTRCSPVD